MDKKVFKSGDVITPEFLNALQDLSFEKSTDEVGGLPSFLILVDSEDVDASNYRYLIDKFIAAGKSADNSYGQDVGFVVVATRGGRRIIGILENKAVTTEKLADNAVTNQKIATGAVSSDSLATNSVVSSKMLDGCVIPEKLASGAVLPEKMDATKMFTAVGWIAAFNESEFARYLPTSITLNGTTSTSVAKTAGFSFSNGGFTCYADIGSFDTLILNGKNITPSAVQNGTTALSFSSVGSQEVAAFTVPAGKILEVFVRHNCSWTGGSGYSGAWTYLYDGNASGDNIHWNFSGSNGLLQSQALIVQNTTDADKTFYLKVNFGLEGCTSVEDNVSYRYVIRIL